MSFKLKHQTHFETAAKFMLLVGMLVLYLFYLIYRYDVSTGCVTLALTWSFFVLCTPIADAGFLLESVFTIKSTYELKSLNEQSSRYFPLISLLFHNLFPIS